jgi:hypothetical protein
LKSFKETADEQDVVQINLPAPPSKYQELLDKQEKEAKT